MSEHKSAAARNIPKPKRFLTAYNFFFMHERAAFLAANSGEVPPPTESSLIQARKKKNRRPHVKTHEKISFTELTKLIVKKWKETPLEDKKMYQELAQKDLARYQKEYKEYKKKLRLLAQDDQNNKPCGSAVSGHIKKNEEPLQKDDRSGLPRKENAPESVGSSSSQLPLNRSFNPLRVGLPVGLPQLLLDHGQQGERPRGIDTLGHGYPQLGLNLVPLPYIIPSELGYFLPVLGTLPSSNLTARPSSGNHTTSHIPRRPSSSNHLAPHIPVRPPLVDPSTPHIPVRPPLVDPPASRISVRPPSTNRQTPYIPVRSPPSNSPHFGADSVKRQQHYS